MNIFSELLSAVLLLLTFERNVLALTPTRRPSLAPSMIPTISPTFGAFAAQLKCTAPSDVSNCSLVCAGSSVGLSDIAVKDTTTYIQRIFGIYDSYQYYFILPVCGHQPSFPTPYNNTVQPTPSWNSSSVWQFSGLTESYYLGRYNSTSWSYGSCNGAAAVSVSFSNGQYCSVVGANRRTTVYVVCASGYTADSPRVSFTEPSTCVLPSRMPSVVPSRMPSVVPSRMPTSTEAPNTSSSSSSATTGIIIGVVVAVIALLLLCGVYYCYVKRRKYSKIAKVSVELASSSSLPSSSTKVQPVPTSSKSTELQANESGTSNRADSFVLPSVQPLDVPLHQPVLQYVTPPMEILQTGPMQQVVYPGQFGTSSRKTSFPAPPVPQNRRIDFLFSFARDSNQDNQYRIAKIHEYLVKTGRVVWWDMNQPETFEEGRQTAAVDRADRYIVFLTRKYYERIHSTTTSDEMVSYAKEFDYAVLKLNAVNVKLVLTEPEMYDKAKWPLVDSYLGGQLFYFCGSNDKLLEFLNVLDDEVPVPEEFQKTAEDFREKLKSSSAEK